MIRRLLLDGKCAFELGIGCQTCGFLFQRSGGANQSVAVEDAVQALRSGVTSLQDEVVSTLAPGLPQGEYIVLLAETKVRLTWPGDANDYFAHEQIALWGEDNFWCLPHDPRVPYYRAGDIDLGAGRTLFNFVVPMYPTRWLTFRTVAQYKQEMEERGLGTAVAMAVPDVKAPADWTGDKVPHPSEHWCLAHFLIDGHHKLHAAAEAGKPLQLLSFVAAQHGVSSIDQLNEAVRAMTGRAPVDPPIPQP